MIGLAFMLAVVGATACHCPQAATSPDLVLAARSPSSATGFVVCGFTDERRGEIVVASEFQIFSCETEERLLLTLGATETAWLRPTSAELQVTEVSSSPFGDEWKWVEVPIYSWRLPYGIESAPERQIVLQPPRISKERLDELHRWYQELIRQPIEVRAEQSEEAVGRVFGAALSGDDRFAHLFGEMPQAMALDGHAAEVYSEAEVTLESYRRAVVRERRAKR